MNQQMLQQAAFMQQQIQQAEQQLAFINEHLSSLEQFAQNINTFSLAKKSEILASIGQGVYAQTALLSDELFVEVGSGIVLKKKPLEVKSILGQQIIKLKEARLYLSQQLEEHSHALARIMHKLEEEQNAAQGSSHSHAHDH